MKKQLSLVEAKRLSLIKWELIVENNGSSSIQYPEELLYLPYRCGFCKRWSEKGYFGTKDCSRCECAKALKGICSEDQESIYTKWQYRSTKENAQAVLDAIKSINTTEYKWYDIRKYFKKK